MTDGPRREGTRGGPAQPGVVYVVRSWPRLSQTFVLNEVLALERLGCDLTIFSMVHSGEAMAQGHVSEVRAPVHYLDDAQARRRRARWREHAAMALAVPLRYLRSLASAVVQADMRSGYTTSSPLACFSQAVHLATIIRRPRRSAAPFAHLHAHFAHDPALIGLFVNRLTGVPFSFSAHARDLYGVPPRGLAARAEPAAAIVTCCRTNADYLRRALSEQARSRVHLIHHGVDLDAFKPAAGPATRDVPRLVSVGRLVEKKGFPDLLHACARVKAAGHRFTCEIYGDGPLRHDLESVRDQLGLAGEVSFGGERRQQELISLLQAADVFVLTPFVTTDGDRDGLPNVLVEAMACALPVVSTSVGGVTDLVAHGENGLLAPPGDPDAVASHLCWFLEDPSRVRQFGHRARRTVEERFDVRAAARELRSLFDGKL